MKEFVVALRSVIDLKRIIDSKCVLAFVTVITIIAMDFGRSDAYGQSLREKLRQEQPEVLITRAMKEGDYARGAVLFTTPKLACSRCHGSDVSSLGPDLTRIPADEPKAALVESLLEPSKAIREGYGASVILTTDGRAIVGRKIRETDDFVEVRASSGDFDRVRISRDEIDTISDSSVSMMPVDLIDQLKSESDFLDLLRYVLEISKEPFPAIASTKVEAAELPPHLRGYQLFFDYNCIECHRGDVSFPSHLVNAAPTLDRTVGLVTDDWLRNYLLDVHGEAPHSRMPDVLASLSDGERREAVGDLVAFLRSLEVKTTHALEEYEVSAKRGDELFHSVGCVACHHPRDSSGKEFISTDGLSLEGLAHKYTLEGLVAFLEDPLQYRPSGRMPSMTLSHWEAQDLAAFLLGGSVDLVRKKHRVENAGNASDVERGRVRFFESGCANCHKTSQPGELVQGTPWMQLRPGKGCLSKVNEGAAPVFPVDENEKSLLNNLLVGLQSGVELEEIDSHEMLTLSLHNLRCIQCHRRGEFGGVSEERDGYFQTDNPNLGPQGRIPPTLDLIGAKTRPTWLRQVLVEGKAIRPYVKTRMPQFGKDNVVHLVDLFQELDHLTPVVHGVVSDEKAFREGGWQMVGSEGMNCIACHTFQQTAAANMSAVDLTDMVERLNKDWFYLYMKNPQEYAVGTVMPTFWPGGKSTRDEFFDGNPNLQIEALWHYLSEGRQSRTPRGLIVEPMELVVGDEAVMLRRSYPGVGKRGIGVGLPNQFNIVFDAEQIRLAMIWRGRFADPSGVWRSQGHGNVRPLGDTVISFPKGPDFDDAEEPWVVDDTRPPLHKFKGYRLDSKRSPTFFYRWDSVEIEESYSDGGDVAGPEPVLRRSIKFRNLGDARSARIRIAAGKQVEQLTAETFRIDDRLTAEIVDGASTEIVQTGDEHELFVLPTLNGHELGSVVVEYSW